MRKQQVLALLLVTAFMLTACQNGLLSDGQHPADKIVLHQMESFGQVKENSRFEVTDDQTIELFAESISRADKVAGVADVADPDFKVEFGDKALYLWIAEGHGSVMDVEDTYTLYTLEEKDADRIHTFLSSENLLD
ncbi:hypothetical protein [Planococcus sp. SSTMD024]|uniref:hypothetical protein n=1 Tax=Planococcus sp. SSTMD024 TaxID=3242163 RepID=UPI00351DB434